MRNRITVITSTIIAIILLWYIWAFQGVRYSEYENIMPFEEFDAIEVSDEAVFEQHFIPENRYLKGIALYMINLAEDRTGEIHIGLYDSQGKSLCQTTGNIEDWQVDEWNWFDLEKRIKPGKEYILRVSFDGIGGTVAPLLLALDNTNTETLVNLTYDNYSGNDMCLAVSSRYANPASGYEKSAYTALVILFLTVIVITQVEVNTPKWFRNTLAVLSVAALFIMYVPNIAYKLKGINLDDSWRYFLNVINPQGYIFGRDVFFTYGPLGYVCYMMNLPGNHGYFVFGVILWSLIIAGFAYVLVMLLKAYWQGTVSLLALLFSCTLAFASYKVIERDNFLLYLLILTVAVYELTKRYRDHGLWPFAVITNFVLTVMFFAKFSTFSSAFAFFTLFTLYNLIFLKNVKGIWLFVPSLVLMPAAYLIYNPSVSGLTGYVRGFLRHSNDWMEAWQYDVTVSGVELVALIVIIGLYVLLLVISIIKDYKNAGFLVAIGAPMFFVYKYATTRHGLPCGIWLFGMLYSVVPLASVSDNSLPKEKRKLLLTACACLFVSGIFEAYVMHNTFGDFRKTLSDKTHNWTHLNEIGISETVYTDWCPCIADSTLQTIGDSSVCIYPYKVSLGAIYPELNVVFMPFGTNGQAARWSDELVADWYASDRGGDYLILYDETVDGHIKYLENPLTWKAIYTNYSFVERGPDYCLLKKTDENMEYEGRKELIKTETMDAGELITVPAGADHVVIKTRYSLLGRIKKFFYHVGTLNMTLNYPDGSVSGRILKGSLETGFDLCEYPQNLEQFEQYMKYGSHDRIESMQIYGLGLKDLDDKITVEWYLTKE